MTRAKPNRLLAEERRREIVKILEQNGRITVEEVVRRFQVSAATARTDLDTLSDSGELVRSHGGGVKTLTEVPEHPLKVREGMNRDEKTRIARRAAQFVRPLQTIILCTGSTSAQLASVLQSDCPANITVITYALNIAAKMAEVPGVSLMMLGGFLRHPSTAFVGPQAEHMMHTLHADHCFLSAVGVDPDVGVTTLDIMEAQLNRRMVESAAQVTLLADSSKFGHRSLALICDLKAIHRVVTDTNAPGAAVEKLRSKGVDVILV